MVIKNRCPMGPIDLLYLDVICSTVSILNSSPGVPRRFFWIIAAFLVLTTTALAWLLHANLNSEIPPGPRPRVLGASRIPEGFENREEEDEAMIFFPARNLRATVRTH